MATSSASLAASKLLNLRNPALQSLVRRHLIHPSAAVAATSTSFHVAQSSNLFRLENDRIDSPDSSSDARNLNLQAYNFVLDLQRSSATRIEAARTYVHSASNYGAYEDSNDDDEDDDDSDVGAYEDSNDDDEDDDDSDVDDYSGSEFEDDDESSDVDEEPHTSTRSSRN